MSRHRDIRSMNYSDEYDGYDDIYGHSVEDDYCVSPSAEQFLYDRNKQPNIASFINEPNIEEGDEEEEADLTSPKSSQLSELDRVKIISAIEIIRNVIGDTIPDTVLTEKIIKFDFDAVAALDDILKSTSPENQSAESNASQEVCGKQESGIKSTPMPRVQVTTPSSIKVIPATSGSVTKGFDLSGIENSELRHPYQESLRSQNLLSEINAQNLRRKDDSTPRNNLDVFKTNALHCQSPHSGRATPEHDSKIKSLVDEKYDVITSYNNRLKESKEQLHLVVVGHVDAGKSTLLGRLLSDLGQVSSRLIHKYQQESKKVGKQSFAYAWVLDETGEERDRGITMDIGYSKFETETKSVTLLDAPGHKDFIPNMITGATQADVALLVVDATRGEFETGFDSGGQTREHALLLRSLGVLQIAVVINKLDMVDWSEDRYNEIVDKMGPFLKQVGFRDSVMFIPCSGLSGENIIESPKVKDLSKWYTGPNLLSVIDNFKCPERPVTKPFRFSINDIFKGTGSGFCVSGHVVTGMITVGNKVLLLPGNEIAIVKGMTIEEVPIQSGFAGDHVSLTISGIDQQNVGIGDIICTPNNPIPVTTSFQSHVIIFAIAIPIIKGLPVVLHVQSLVEPAVITKLVKQLHRNTGEVIKHKPRCLLKNSSAIIEITTQRPICLELYKDIKQLGRVMLRVSGTTIAAGLITKIK